MEMTNYLGTLEPSNIQEEGGTIRHAYLHALETMLRLLSPFVPHITEELWHEIGHTGFLFNETWPNYNENLVKQDIVTVVLQVNGKLRDRIEVPRDSDEESIRQMALSSDRIKKYLEGKELVKVIVVPNKLLNIVVK
jgi:leucyl-tRNA synthetase